MARQRYILWVTLLLVLAGCASDVGHLESNRQKGYERKLDSVLIVSSLSAELSPAFGGAFNAGLVERLERRGVRAQALSPATAEEFAGMDFVARARAVGASFTLLVQSTRSTRLAGGVRQAEIDLSLYDNQVDRRVWRASAPLGGAPVWRSSANDESAARMAQEAADRLATDGLI